MFFDELALRATCFSMLSLYTLYIMPYEILLRTEFSYGFTHSHIRSRFRSWIDSKSILLPSMMTQYHPEAITLSAIVFYTVLCEHVTLVHSLEQL